MDLKHILPIEINYAIKHIKDHFRQKTIDCEPDALMSKKRVFFLDAPAYGNIGDQAIALAMETYMADTLPNYKQIEVTEDQLPSSLQCLKSVIQKEDIICLTGGGNMGVMYQKYESVRRLVIKGFPQNPIIIFPQTFDYGSTNYALRELNTAKKLYATAEKLIICARDKESYSQMSICFPKAKVLFCPDIVLYLDYRKRFQKNNCIGICLRNDKERALTEDEHRKIIERYPYAAFLTTIDKTELPITRRNRKTVVERKLEEFGTKDLILTDRLHGAIFAFITGTPCIAFPNSNGKVERICSYLSEFGNVSFTRTVPEVVLKSNKKNGTIKDKFGELSDAVRSLAKS